MQKKLHIDKVEEATDYKIKMGDVRMKNKTNDTYSLRKIKETKCERELQLQVHPFRGVPEACLWAIVKPSDLPLWIFISSPGQDLI